MDLEQLTKHQIILLTLLVSFVTSIATGIVTVSLMNQAPPSVSRTINQIVERTVETVAPAVPTGGTVEKTVVVKNDDLAAQSIAAVQKAIIRITARGDTQLVARGVIVGKDGTALTDAAALEASGASNFDALLPGGQRVPVIIPKGQGTSTPILTVSVAVGTTTGWAPAPLADPTSLSLGTSVIRIGGVGSDMAAEGIIASLPQDSGVAASVESTTPGSVLITLFGDIIGLSTGASQDVSPYYYTLVPAPAASSTQATSNGS
jgi:hypothetical protein